MHEMWRWLMVKDIEGSRRSVKGFGIKGPILY